MFARPVRALAHGIWHLTGLADAIADLAVIVTNDHDRTKN